MARSYYVKRKLSGSTSGKRIKIAATSSPGTTIHQAQNSTADGYWDEVFINVYNSDADPVDVTIQWGGTSSPDDDIKFTLASKEGLEAEVLGDILQNNLEIKAYASKANVVTVGGYVNRITES